VLTAPAARRIAQLLRAPQPLADALADAAAEMRGLLGARGVALVVRREGRSHRGQSGTIADHVTEIPLADADVEGTLMVSGAAQVSEELALIVTLALSARFLAESAQTDGLTGVANRRTFDLRFEEEWLRAKREGTSLAVAILDIDYFKVYNDRHGHLAGDDALRRVAHAASANLQRAGDRFARYGGEEFAAILPATTLAGGIAAAERIRNAVTALAIPHPVGKAGRLTVSIGVAAAEPARGGSAHELLAAADRELYRAKAEGRDRVAAEGYALEHARDEGLPQPFSALIGRDEDLATVRRAIDAHRVVTIAGDAGVGKTRLALAVAHEAAPRFARVRFVDALGAVTREELLARLAAALGVLDADPALGTIAGALTEPALLVLDGCERIAGACREVVDALAETPLRWLITSRTALDARDERVVHLSPLDERAAGTLFADRAHALAALDERETRAFAAVAVFRGSFTAGDAAAVIADEAVDARRADALLRAFAARSLLDAASHGGITRWRMIDPVREALAAIPRFERHAPRAHAAHLRWCRARLDAIAARTGTGTNHAALVESETVIDEVRAALDRALQDESLVRDGAELCYVAVRQWFAVRHPHEGRLRCEAFIGRSERLAPVHRARLHAAAARLAFVEGDLVATETHARAADALLGEDDAIERSTVLNFLGIVAKFRGDYGEAERLFRLGCELNARIGNKRGEAIAIGALGTVVFDFRLDHDEAVRRFREAAATFRAIHDDLNALVMLGNTAESLAARGDVAEAARIVTAAVEESRAFGNRATSAQLLCVSALVADVQGDRAGAARAMREVVALLAAGSPGAVMLMAFDFAARIVAHSGGDDVLAATLVGAAERHAAAQATPLLPIQRFWRDPIVAQLRERLGARYDDAAARARTTGEGELLAALDDFLQTLERTGASG